MKTILLLGMLLFPVFVYPQRILEAEDARLDSDLSIQTGISGYSGSGYVQNFANPTDSVKFVFSVTETDEYFIKFRTNREGAHEIRYRFNNSTTKNLSVPDGDGWRYSDSVSVYLNEGEHTVVFEGYWGYLLLDCMAVTKNIQEPYDYSQVNDTLVNHKNATSYTKDLYNYLLKNYGKKIISGYTGQSSGGYFWEAANAAGAVSKIYNIDMNTFTRGYAYGWSNEIKGQVFKWHDNGQIDSAIARHNAGNIIAAQWHWYAPSGGHGTSGTVGARGEKVAGTTFSASLTDFDITKAVVPGNSEYEWLIEDIDSIAGQLKRLEDAGVPVLWRPLHEAAGQWFWWGDDKASFIKLWDILYKRLTDYHKINNLIWVLGQAYPEKNWLVDSRQFDITGFDNYPGAFDYSSQKERIELCREQVGHKKMVALTETGPIPDPEFNINRNAMYSYFVAWAQESLSKFNTDSHMHYVYNHDHVIVLKTINAAVATRKTIGSPQVAIYPNPCGGQLTIKPVAGNTVRNMTVQILSMNGKMVYQNKMGRSRVVNVESLYAGIYLVKISSPDFDKTFKLIKTE